jgi:glycosyltransferase involved in cell wall biosynthesis
MKVLALPRDPNPYQRLLYEACAQHGMRVRYVGDLTPSHTLNLLLLPLELALWRARGWDTLHVHWVFGFRLPGSGRVPGAARLSQLWFRLVLAVSRALGLRVVWTAHNTLPHEPVFDDDAAARRALVGASDLVVTHSSATLSALEQIGARPRRSAVIPPGPFHPKVDPDDLRQPGSDESGARRLLFFGKVIAYKGVEDLLDAACRLPADVDARIVVVGECLDSDLRQRIETLAGRVGERVELRLVRVDDDEVTSLMSAADAVVLPFRRVTTSASALLAMEHGRPLVLPDLPAFEDLPDDAVLRYDGSVDGLAQALADIASWDAERLAAAGGASRRYADGLSWTEAAGRTVAALNGGGTS